MGVALAACALPVSWLRADLFQDGLQEREGAQDVLAGERPRSRRTAGRECLLDRAVLLGVLQIEPVDRMVARRPHRRPRERPARALRHLLDERQVGDAIRSEEDTSELQSRQYL